MLYVILSPMQIFSMNAFMFTFTYSFNFCYKYEYLTVAFCYLFQSSICRTSCCWIQSRLQIDLHFDWGWVLNWASMGNLETYLYTRVSCVAQGSSDVGWPWPPVESMGSIVREGKVQEIASTMAQVLCPLLSIRFNLFLISTLGGFFILRMDKGCIRDA